MKTEDILARVRYDLPETGKIVVGLSGGADSVLLTYLLVQKYGAERLPAVHVHHGIRGAEADRDAEFVQGCCKALELHCKVIYKDIPALAAVSGEGVEECARRVRYACFAEEAGENGCIATAHNADDNAETLLSGFYEIFSGTSWSHVWYLYLMIGIYLLLPFYHKIASNSTAGELRYLMIVYAIFLSLVPVLKTFGISVGFYICVSAIYPFYLFCGYALRQGVWRVNRGLGLLFLLIGTAAVVLFTVLKENGTVKAAGVFYGYSSIFVILQSIGVFTLFGCAADKTGAPRKEKSPGVFGKFVLEIDKCSFGIYLIHMIFVRGILKHTKLHPYGAGSPFVLIGLTLGIFLVSFILTWILKKIPGVKKIL